MLSNRQHLGYATLSSPEGMRENDTFTCAHCQRIVHIPPKGSGKPVPGGGCARCGHRLICDNCVDLGTCDPWEKKLERIEARARFRRQLGI